MRSGRYCFWRKFILRPAQNKILYLIGIWSFEKYFKKNHVREVCKNFCAGYKVKLSQKPQRPDLIIQRQQPSPQMQQQSPQQISYNNQSPQSCTKFVGSFVVASVHSVVASKWWDQDTMVFENVYFIYPAQNKILYFIGIWSFEE